MPKSRNEKKVVLFEDNREKREERVAALSAELGEGVVVAFPATPGALPKEEGKAIESRLISVLKSSGIIGGEIGLLVCDMSLDNYQNEIPSATIVLAAAESMGLPICLYEACTGQTTLQLDRRRNWAKDAIVIDDASRSFTKQCTGLYHGFNQIEADIAEISVDDFSRMTPAEIMAKILDNPEETHRIALYSMGEQSFIAELVAQDNGCLKDLKERYYRILGNWLYTSILRYPGILVDEVAAASYLNISMDCFAKDDARQIFAAARYSGPFARCGNWWWRNKLDDLLIDADLDSGLDLLKLRGLDDAEPCYCEEADDGHPAGFLCMMTRKPVCEEHSRGGISWFPGGADLARVAKSEYQKWGPFMGLY